VEVSVPQNIEVLKPNQIFPEVLLQQIILREFPLLRARGSAASHRYPSRRVDLFYLRIDFALGSRLAVRH
jgi:hypothetical protein